jgi:hypothetical protein
MKNILIILVIAFSLTSCYNTLPRTPENLEKITLANGTVVAYKDDPNNSGIYIYEEDIVRKTEIPCTVEKVQVLFKEKKAKGKQKTKIKQKKSDDSGIEVDLENNANIKQKAKIKQKKSDGSTISLEMTADDQTNEDFWYENEDFEVIAMTKEIEEIVVHVTPKDSSISQRILRVHGDQDNLFVFLCAFKKGSEIKVPLISHGTYIDNHYYLNDRIDFYWAGSLLKNN